MEALVVEILPDIYEWLEGYVFDVFGFLAGGLLVSFILWTIAFAIDSVFGWLRKASEF